MRFSAQNPMILLQFSGSLIYPTDETEAVQIFIIRTITDFMV